MLHSDYMTPHCTDFNKMRHFQELFLKELSEWLWFESMSNCSGRLDLIWIYVPLLVQHVECVDKQFLDSSVILSRNNGPGLQLFWHVLAFEVIFWCHLVTKESKLTSIVTTVELDTCGPIVPTLEGLPVWWVVSSFCWWGVTISSGHLHILLEPHSVVTNL